ncbi:hypothetical protein KBY29_17455 [Ruegeria pomeroyi]|nr:hypothetical protein [Ruegeria pomeroyi]
MQILVGIAGLSLAVLIYAWAYGRAHDPAAPAWARGQLFASAASLFATSLAPIGAGYLTAGILWPDGLSLVWGLPVAIGAVPLVWIVARRLLRRGHDKAHSPLTFTRGMA